MKNQFVLFTFILIAFALNVQAQDGYTTKQLTDLVGQLNWDRRIQEGNDNIAGTPYLEEEFKNGDVYYDKEFKVEQVPLRLNLYNDEFEYKVKNTVMAFADPGHIDKIVIDTDVYIYLDQDTGPELHGFVKKWNEQLPSIVTKMKTEFLNKEEPKPFEDTKPDRFDRKLDKNYVMVGNSEFEKISSVKKLIKYLGDHNSELTSFAKKEKISSGDPEELAKLLEYFHSLK